MRTVVIACRDRKHQGIDSKVSSIIHLDNLTPETSIHSYKTVDVFESNVRDSLEMGFKSYSDQTLIGSMSQMLGLPNKVLILIWFLHLALSLSLSDIVFNDAVNQWRKKSHAKLKPVFDETSSVVKYYQNF